MSDEAAPEVLTAGAALDQQGVRFERLIVRVELVIAALSVLLSAYVALRISVALGVQLAIVAAALGTWWALCDALLARGRGLALVRLVNPFLEASVGTVVVLLDYRAKGAVYAATAPGMLLYGLFAQLSVLRLRPALPVFVGLVGSAEYALVYALVLAPALRASHAFVPGAGGDMAVLRVLLLSMSGIGGSAVSLALRRAMTRATSAVRASDLYGKYQLGPLIASGGMGSVYRATYCPEGSFRRPVALKKIHPHLAQQEDLVTAFRAEAELCARLLHPNIVQVLDFGRIDDTFFLAMEYVDGFTLAEILRRVKQTKQQIPARLCAFVGRELCRGLGFAHQGAQDEQGQVLRVVHRDLNPPNVLVSRAGQVKVLDYGIARALRDGESTTTRTTSGKVGYMSPEQAKGASVDERCDLYAVGITLWELLALEPLFKRENELATLNALLYTPLPSIRTVRPELSAEWDEFFARSLARNVDDRYQTAAEMGAALEGLLELEGLPRPGELQGWLRSLPEVARGERGERGERVG